MLVLRILTREVQCFVQCLSFTVFQLFPYAVMDLLGHLPGIPGLFVAGIYSSSLRFATLMY